MKLLRYALAPVLLGAALSGCGPTANSGTPVGPTATGTQPGAVKSTASRPDKPDFTTTAEALSKEVFADDKATAAKYTGKWVEVEGTVDDANKMFHDSGFVMKGAKKSEKEVVGYIIRCGVPAADAEKVWHLAKGQKVSFVGKAAGLNGFSFELTDGAVKELEPSKLVVTTAEALAGEYAKDAEATQKKYLGDKYDKDIMVSGTVADLTEKDGFYTVALAGTGNTQVRCTFDKKEWEKLKAGDKVTVKGNLSSFDEKAANSPTVNTAFLVKKG